MPVIKTEKDYAKLIAAELKVRYPKCKFNERQVASVCRVFIRYFLRILAKDQRKVRVPYFEVRFGKKQESKESWKGQVWKNESVIQNGISEHAYLLSLIRDDTAPEVAE